MLPDVRTPDNENNERESGLPDSRQPHDVEINRSRARESVSRL
jgi:hypothetical protein